MTIEAIDNARIIYSATEQKAINIPLDELYVDGRLSLYPEVQGKNYFRVYLKDDRIVFQASGFVGLIPINKNCSIDVKPRFPIENIEQILFLSEQKPHSLNTFSRRYTDNVVQPHSIVDYLAESLIGCLNNLMDIGFHQEFRHVNSSTSFPHGRIDMIKTIQQNRAKGINHIVNVSWFQRTRDIPVNQLMKYALFYLANRLHHYKKSAVQQRLASSINDLYHCFNGIDLDHSRNFLNDNFVNFPSKLPTLRRYYVDPVSLSLAIIRDRGVTFDSRGDQILMVSLLLNMESIFENYVRMVLYRGLPKLDQSLFVLDGNKSDPIGARKKLFDDTVKHDATPDIVIVNTPSHNPLLIVEVKYKQNDTSPAREDINQTIVYAQSYRTKNAIIVQPTSKGIFKVENLGSIDKVTIYSMYLDLSVQDLQMVHESLCTAVAEIIRQ